MLASNVTMLTRATFSRVAAHITAYATPQQKSFLLNHCKNQLHPRCMVNITFYEEANANRINVNAPLGKSVLDVAIDNNIDIEGACGGELACSTCHVILSKELFDKLPPKTEEEEDMLDLAWGLTDT